MTRRYRLLVFDWDGTLMDSAALIASSIRNACGDLALPIPSENEARYIIGLGLQDALQRLLPEVPQELYPRIAERYREHFLARDQESPLFEGVRSMLEVLAARGYWLAVATGKSRAGLERALKHSGLAPVFHASRCADESFTKPHPGMLHDVMDVLGAQAHSTLMIGDTSHDLLMAANAGVEALAVTYGAHPRAELVRYSPLACCDSVPELEQWLLSQG